MLWNIWHMRRMPRRCLVDTSQPSCRLPTNGRSRHFGNLNNIEIYSNIIYEDLCKCKPERGEWNHKPSAVAVPVDQPRNTLVYENPFVLISNGIMNTEMVSVSFCIWFLNTATVDRQIKRNPNSISLSRLTGANLLRFGWFWPNKYALISLGGFNSMLGPKKTLRHVKRVWHPPLILLEPRLVFAGKAVAFSALVELAKKWFSTKNIGIARSLCCSFLVCNCHPFTVRLSSCTRIRFHLFTRMPKPPSPSVSSQTMPFAISTDFLSSRLFGLPSALNLPGAE